MRNLRSAIALSCFFAACRPGFAEEVSGAVHLQSGRAAGMAVVIFKGAAHARPLARAVVDQRGRKFIPHVSVVTVGTKVDFPNNDTVFHNVFTEFHSTKFDLGTYPRGATRSQVFRQTGLAVLLCSVHPDMSAYVMVVDTPYYAVADGNGRYRISGIPAGSYDVEIWHESGEKLTKRITVSGSEPQDFALHR